MPSGSCNVGNFHNGSKPICFADCCSHVILLLCMERETRVELVYFCLEGRRVTTNTLPAEIVDLKCCTKFFIDCLCKFFIVGKQSNTTKCVCNYRSTGSGILIGPGINLFGCWTVTGRDQAQVSDAFQVSNQHNHTAFVGLQPVGQASIFFPMAPKRFAR